MRLQLAKQLGTMTIPLPNGLFVVHVMDDGMATCEHVALGTAPPVIDEDAYLDDPRARYGFSRLRFAVCAACGARIGGHN